ncbi:hypothetical protein IWX83_002590 [Flavobacterium sp. CG_9.1]|uniref:hypothetical protein n=1 Tax=Flavobacterium sp. CG_9.1 TaxID=2787728 RepID=UPI0018CBDA5D|nr:hypothetical protein [Flavobacterium sp. CG_9.1]MBG6062789.1 hypothetical protein [Flavobacterium sp. CG_9.1]
MKKQKSTYVTDLTYEILINMDLLDEWAKNSKDLEFLELSTEILSDTDLLFSWDCNNILNLKLSAIKSNGKDLELKSGMVIQVDGSDKFPMKPFLYKMAIKAMIEKKSMNDIIKEDFVNQGNSVEQINNAERMARMTNLLESVQYMDQYSLPSQIKLFSKVIPESIDRFKKDAKEFYKRKTDEILYLGDNIESGLIRNGIDDKKDIEKSNFNRNNWNQECFNLFNFLVDNYEKKGKVKFINIYYFLKNKTDKNVYVFKYTIDHYKLFISSNYEIQFKTFKVAEFEFEDQEAPLLLSFEQDFRKMV